MPLRVTWETSRVVRRPGLKTVVWRGTATIGEEWILWQCERSLIFTNIDVTVLTSHHSEVMNAAPNDFVSLRNSQHCVSRTTAQYPEEALYPRHSCEYFVWPRAHANKWVLPLCMNYNLIDIRTGAMGFHSSGHVPNCIRPRNACQCVPGLGMRIIKYHLQ